MADSKNISEFGYWLDQKFGNFDETLFRKLVVLFKGSSVIDCGCASGRYVRAFRKRNIVCVGYDGNPHTENYEYCHTVNLAQLADLMVADWVLSLETGEHIPAQYEDIFLENLHKHNRKGIVLTWARVGQGGRGHVNERPVYYVRNKVEKLGYFSDFKWQRILRESVSLSWLKRIMVFRRALLVL